MKAQLRSLIADPPDPSASRLAVADALSEAIANDEMRSALVELVREPGEATTEMVAPSRRRRWPVRVASVAAGTVVIVAGLSLFGPSQPAESDFITTIDVLPESAFGEAEVVRVSSDEFLTWTEVDGEPIPFAATIERTERMDADGVVEATNRVTSIVLLDPGDAIHLDQIRREMGYGNPDVFRFRPELDDYALFDSDIGFLEAVSDQHARWGDRETPFEVYLLEKVTSIFAAGVPTGDQRKTMLEALVAVGTIDRETDEDRLTFTYEFETAIGDEIIVLEFDETGWLVSRILTFEDALPEKRLPAGRMSISRFQPPSTP